MRSNADTPIDTINELQNVDQQRNKRLGAMSSFAKIFNNQRILK